MCLTTSHVLFSPGVMMPLFSPISSSVQTFCTACAACSPSNSKRIDPPLVTPQCFIKFPLNVLLNSRLLTTLVLSSLSIGFSTSRDRFDCSAVVCASDSKNCFANVSTNVSVVPFGELFLAFLCSLRSSLSSLLYQLIRFLGR